ncbi:hypothetical protein BGY98DRAFT_953252 [Russula aff. rugulosa BPL654]|nr:hypothetical protein BGY98DRAFT_953252 [Russula aff. rugulosa BPL654]
MARPHGVALGPSFPFGIARLIWSFKPGDWVHGRYGDACAYKSIQKRKKESAFRINVSGRFPVVL